MAYSRKAAQKKSKPAAKKGKPAKSMPAKRTSNATRQMK
jgi:hypothetical protein